MVKNKKFNLIKSIVKDWNPLDVPKNIAEDEYNSYIWQMINLPCDKSIIKEHLKSFLCESLGLEFSTNNVNQNKEVNLVCEKIYNALK